MACETGVSPQDLMTAPPGVLDAMVAYLVRRAEDQKKAAKTARTRRR